MGLVFGFSNGKIADLEEQGVKVESRFTVKDGETVVDDTGTYISTAEPKDE